MKRSTLRLLVSLTIVVFFGWVFLFSSTKPRILVLHSLSQPSDWATRVDQGIVEILRKNRQPVAVVYHYMDLDVAGSETETRVATAAARQAIAKEKPDILVAVDDESNTLVASQLPASSRPAIVYTAILQTPESYGYGPQSRSTGAEEDVPSAAIIDLLKIIRGAKPLRIAVLGVEDVTGRAELARLQADEWGKHTLEPVKLVSTFRQWQAFVTEEASNADVLVVLSTDMLASDRPGEFLPEKAVIEWTETHARALPIGIRDSYVRYGGGLAVTSPGSVYGRLAMQISLDWLKKGLHATPPDRVGVNDFNIALRHSVLKQRGIELPSVYQELARATGGLYP